MRSEYEERYPYMYVCTYSIPQFNARVFICTTYYNEKTRVVSIRCCMTSFSSTSW